MESVNLDMDDFFEREAGTLEEEREDYGSGRVPMPDLETDELPMAEEQQTQEEGDADVLSKLKDIKKGAAKKRVMKPQPKLDGLRLTGERGLPALVNLFTNVKFKGKGYEAEDLKVMMSKLEHWGHRLFPKMPFDELLERVEKLGAKGDVKTCLKRIRLDIPLVNGEIIEEPEVIDNPIEPEVEFDAEAAYDEMIRQEREMLQIERDQEPSDTVQRVEPASPVSEINKASSPEPLKSNPSSVAEKPACETPARTPGPQVNQGITPEQKKRLEMNKLNALKKKAARLGVPLESLLPAKPAEVTIVNTDSNDMEKSSQNSQHGSTITNKETANGECEMNSSTVSVCVQPSLEKIDATGESMERESTGNATTGETNDGQIQEGGNNKTNESSNRSSKADNQDIDMETEEQILSSLCGSDTDEVLMNTVDRENRETSETDKTKGSDGDIECEKDGGKAKPLLKVCAEPVLDSCVNGEIGDNREDRGGSVGECRKGSGGEDLVLEFSDETNTTHEEETLQSP